MHGVEPDWEKNAYLHILAKGKRHFFAFIYPNTTGRLATKLVDHYFYHSFHFFFLFSITKISHRTAACIKNRFKVSWEEYQFLDWFNLWGHFHIRGEIYLLTVYVFFFSDCPYCVCHLYLFSYFFAYTLFWKCNDILCCLQFAGVFGFNIILIF